MRLFAAVCAIAAMIVFQAAPSSAAEHKINFQNNCRQPIWVGSTGNAKAGGGFFPPAGGGGWKMGPRGSRTAKKTLTVPAGWGGRFWPRTGCRFKNKVCKPGTTNCCDTGGCLGNDNHTFSLKCAYSGVAPVPLLEFTFDATDAQSGIVYDTYDMSMVDGFNLAFKATPKKGTYNREADPDPGRKTPWCGMAGCSRTPECPGILSVQNGKSCQSPCQYQRNSGAAELVQEQYCCACSMAADSKCLCGQSCCAGHYGCSPYTDPPWPDDMVCNPWSSDPAKGWASEFRQYIDNVKAVCPWVYSWQFDDKAGTFNCRKTKGKVAYQVVFCPK